jgi:hypothetical protein
MTQKLVLRPVKFDQGSESQSRFHNGWHEPLLDLYSQLVVFPPQVPAIPKLYLVPTPEYLEGEEPDPEMAKRPSPLTDLPKLDDWVGKYVVSLVEICGGKRPVQQLARWTHRVTYQQLISLIGQWKPLPKIRKFYISEPLEGIAEVTITLRFETRVRALALRFEGIEKRWVCTNMELI